MTALVISPQEYFVADDIELFLCFALHIDTAADFVAKLIVQRSERNGMGDGFAGNRYVQNQRVEVATGTGEAAALLNQKSGERLALR